MLYAQGLLPFLLPLGILLFEPSRHRRRAMLPFTVIGGLLTLYVLWALSAFPTQVYIQNHSIVYINPETNATVVAVLYVIVTCGALFFSRIRPMILFGVANLIILLATMAVKRYAFTSVWCAYAAAASILLWFGLRATKSQRPFQYLDVA